MTEVAMGQPRVLLLNGGSSSGKSTLSRQLQQVLPGTWLRLGVDTLVEACPPRLLSDNGIDLRSDGAVVVGAEFIAVELCWMSGVARMAEVGARVIIEDNFVSGPSGQQRWRAALKDLDVVWIGVRCSAPEAARRELTRGDRNVGMAADQAERVHAGIAYDFEVDTESSSVRQNAEFIRRRLFSSTDA